MTAPDERPEHGADDQWADELHAMALDIEAVHRAALPLPMPDIDEGDELHAVILGERAGELETRCLCPHVRRLHHGRDHTGPCTRPCGCTGYRDLAQHERDREVAQERAIEAAADARADLAAELRDDTDNDIEED